MSGLSIPLKTGSSATAVAYDTAIDGAYSIYNATIKNYPVANAFVDGADTSQEKWWLQVSARATQNNAWKAQLSFGVTSGTGVLSRRSITYPFGRTISKIDDASIQAWFYWRWQSTVTFNESTNVLAASRWWTNTSVTWRFQKSYIATSGGNKFAIMADGSGIYSYAVSATGVLTTWTVLSTQTIPFTPTLVGIQFQSSCFIAAVKWQFIWWIKLSKDGQGSWWGIFRVHKQLFSIDSAWVMTTVWSQENDTVFTFASNGSNTANFNSWSYTVNNTAHLVSLHGIAGPDRSANYHTIDLTNTSAFADTLIKTDNASTTLFTAYTWLVNVWYDGTSALIVTWLGTISTPDIYKIDATSLADTGVNASFAPTETAQYRQTTTVMSTDTNQVRTSSDKFKIKWSDTNGSITNLSTNSVWMYEMTGTNNESQQSALIWVYTPNTCVATGTLTLKANTVTVDTNVLSNTINVPVSQILNVSNANISSDRINFELSYDNIDANDTKIWFWLTWWTYASPTGNYETSTINLTLG